MKKLKNITYLLCMVIIVTCINGCSLTKEKVNPVALRMQMLEFVEKKYDMKFIATYFTIGNGNSRLNVYPKGGDKEKEIISVIGTQNKKTNKYEDYEDNYSAIKMADKYKEKLEELLNPYFESYSVEVRADMCYLPNEFGLDSSYEDVLDQEIEYEPHVFIKVAKNPDSVDEFNSKVEKLKGDIANNKINGLIVFFHLTGDDLTHEVTSYESYDVRRFIRFKGVGLDYDVYED